MKHVFLVAIAGGMGSLSRWMMSELVQRVLGNNYSWGTTVVNILGCLLFGFVWSFFESRIDISPDVRTIVLTGFLGAFTTFSTFIFETTRFMNEAQWLLAGGNILLQTMGGLFLFFVGMNLGKLI